MKDNTILLVHSINSQWGKYINDMGYHVFQVLREQNLLARGMRKADLLSNRDQFNIGWLEKWTQNINQYDTIILFAHPLYRKIVKYIRKQAPLARIIVWYMDPYESCPLRIDEEDGIEEFSFDILDCKKHGFNYKDTFYCFDKEKEFKNEVSTQNNDVFYIGLDKGRYDYINAIRKRLEYYGLNCDITIVKDRWTSVSFNEILKRKRREYGTAISYDRVLHRIQNSKALLDINQLNQSGVSQRPLEALFYNKKLITNNRYIKKMDFYNKNNIYIIENESLYGIKDFMNLPYISISNEVKEKYTFEGWVSQF